MKNKLLTIFQITAIICLAVSTLLVSPLYADEGTKLKLTTCDLHKPYIIIDIVHVRTGQPDVAKVNELLLEEAKKLEADCVIGVGYMEAYGYLFGYGTAVKVK
jgi:hypothetical protein